MVTKRVLILLEYLRFAMRLMSLVNISRHQNKPHNKETENVPSNLQCLRVSLGLHTPLLSSNNGVVEDGYFRRNLTANGKLRSTLLKNQPYLRSCFVFCTHPAA